MYIDFEYDGRMLSDFGCIVCSINSNSGNYDIDIGCDISFTELKNNNTFRRSKTSSTYEKVYTATFDIMKYDCNSRSEEYMTSLEAREIIKWLNREDYYRLRMVNNIADESNVYYYGSFNIKQIMLGDNILGLTLTFTSNAPFGFSDVVENKMMLLNANDVVSIVGDSDRYGIIYPRVEIKCFADGDLKIHNETTGNTLEIRGCMNGETIVVDGEYGIIYSNKRDDAIIANDFEYEYFDILIDKFGTENIYSSTLSCEVTINYLPVRKVGVI